MPDKQLTIEQLLTMLAQTPTRITALTAELTPAQAQAAPSPGEWSINEVLAHLRSCADMWDGSIIRLLAEDRPTIRAINPVTWIKRTNYCELDFQTSLQSFVEQRAALLAALEALPPQAWTRSGTFTGAGRPIERTVHSLAQRLGIHERPHIKQMERTAKAISGNNQP